MHIYCSWTKCNSKQIVLFCILFPVSTILHTCHHLTVLRHISSAERQNVWSLLESMKRPFPAMEKLQVWFSGCVTLTNCKNRNIYLDCTDKYLSGYVVFLVIYSVITLMSGSSSKCHWGRLTLNNDENRSHHYSLILFLWCFSNLLISKIHFSNDWLYWCYWIWIIGLYVISALLWMSSTQHLLNFS